jgi:hypothetical protein
MTEILYSAKHDRMFLFTGSFKIDFKTKRIVIYVQNRGKKVKLNATDLIHIGWL